jgi:hypothetical protein
LAQGLTATLGYVKNKMTEQVIAELLFVGQSVVSETRDGRRPRRARGPVVGQAQADWPPAPYVCELAGNL